MYVSTIAAQEVIRMMEQNICVAVTGSLGVGKTATIRHVALIMKKYYQCNIIPVRCPKDIERYCNMGKLNLFVVDDFCGKYEMDEEEFKNWDKCSMTFTLNDRCKLIFSCRLHVFRDSRF